MTSRYIFQGIQAKTFFVFFLVFVVIIVPVNFLIYNKVKDLLAKADTSELRFEAEKLSALVKLDPLAVPLPAPGYTLKMQLNNNDVFFQEVFTSPDFPLLQPLQYFEDEVQEDTFKIITLRKTGFDSGQLFFSLARSNRRLEQQLNDLRFYLFTANAASILVAGIVVFIVTGITLRPIKKIIKVADRINVSKSIERVPIPPSNDENRLLAETINAMLARMEHTIQNQTNFFASATHELKTPLAVMQAELSLALQNETKREVTKILQSCLAETQRLDRVIQDFLLISQLRSESLVLRTQRIELDEVCYSALKKLKYLMQEQHKSVQVKVDDKPLWVDADYDKMETVISNLLENALKYSPEGAIVAVKVNKNQGRVGVVISNPVTQVILHPQELKEEFAKSEELSSGLGMGLWICDKIIALHQAQLDLQYHEGTFIATVILPEASC